VTRDAPEQEPLSGREEPTVLAWVARGYTALLELLTFVINVGLVALVLVVLLAVAVRYIGIFPGSLHWATEFSRFAIIWIVMLGSAVALDRGAHMAIDISEFLPVRWRRVIRSTGYLLGLAFLGVLAWQGFKLSFATMRQISPALGFPMGYAYLAIPIGAAIMALQSVLFAVVPGLAGKGERAPDGVPDTTF
jgi:TRAP-type C4-dicarboxylate transport system permease small subunit